MNEKEQEASPRSIGEKPSCKIVSKYDILTPSGHLSVNGTCLHLGEGRVEIRSNGGEIVGVLFDGGVCVVKGGKTPEC